MLGLTPDAEFIGERTKQDAAAPQPPSIARSSGAPICYAASTANSTVRPGASMPARSERGKHRIINRSTAGCIELNYLRRNLTDESANAHQALPLSRIGCRYELRGNAIDAIVWRIVVQRIIERAIEDVDRARMFDEK